MIHNTVGLGWKQTWAKRKRSFFSLIGVTFAVALLIGIYVLQGQMNYALNKQITDLYGKTDMMFGYRHVNKLLNEEQVAKIESSSSVLDSGRALVNPHKNHPEYQGKSTGIFYFGVDNSAPAKSLYKFHVNLSAGEVILPAKLSEKFNVQKGDIANIPFPGGKTQQWKVAEVLPKNNGGPDIIYFHLESLQKAFGLEHQYDFLLLDLKSGIDKREIATSFKSTIAEDLDADYMDSLEDAKQNINSIKFMSYVLAVLVMLTSILLVLSNYHISLRERVRELAVMRAIGFSRGKLLKVSLTESVCIHTAGILLGIVLGLWLPNVLRQIISEWLNVKLLSGPLNLTVIAILAAICWIVFTLVSLIPAYRSTGILPLAAIRQLEWKDSLSTKFPFVGLGISLIGMVIFTAIQFFHFSNGLSVILQVVTGVITVIGLFICTPFLMYVFFRFIGGFLERLFGRDALISVKSAMDQRRQSAVIVMVMALAITLSFTVLSLILTLKIEMVRNIEQEYVSDLLVKSNRSMMSSLPYQIGKDIEEIKGVKYALPISPQKYAGFTELQGAERDINFVMGDLNRLSKYNFIPSFSIPVEEAIFLPRAEAEKRNIKLGQTIRLSPDNFSKQSASFKVAGILESVPGYESDVSKPFLLDWNNPFFREYLQKRNEDKVYKVIVDTDGSHLSAVKEELISLERRYPEMRTSDKKTAMAEVNELLAQRTVIFWSIISIILLIGTMGMMNTMSALIHAKRREYAILRAVSVTPARLAKIIALQSLLYVAAAIVIGLITGFILSYSFVNALDGTIIIPYRELALVIAIMALSIGVVTWPLAQRIGTNSVASELSNAME
jgi:putative ABC transport system permease protein